MEEITRPLRMGGCGEDEPLVSAEHLQPALEVGGVVYARLELEAQVRAQERGPEFRDLS
jgi:hypothetical protein